MGVRPLIGAQHVTLAAHRPQVAGQFRVLFNLAPEARHLDVYGAAAAAGAGQLDEFLAALRGLIEKDLVDFEYPTYQVLSLPEATER